MKWDQILRFSGALFEIAGAVSFYLANLSDPTVDEARWGGPIARRINQLAKEREERRRRWQRWCNAMLESV